MLTDADLVLVQASSSTSGNKLTQAVDTALPEAYESPDLIKFGDLETLILSGE
jgi:hypothetical protein